MNGDFWINTATNTIFGPKAGGSWPGTGTSLVGSTGAAGANGSDGATGATGAIGPQGNPGATGSAGADGEPGSIVGVNAKTASYALALGDAGKLVTVDAAGNTVVTVPAHSAVAYDTGAQIHVARLGAGNVKVSKESGVTLHSPGAKFGLASRYSRGLLCQVASDSWLLTGDLDYTSNTPYADELLTVASTDLDLYWRLGTSGEIDTSGNSRNGTVSGTLTVGNATSLIPAEADGATTFDGSNKIQNTASRWDMGTSYTVLAFFSTTRSGTMQRLVDRDYPYPARNFQLRMETSNKMSFITINGSNEASTATGATVINDGSTHMVAAVCSWDGTTRTTSLYIDGTSDATPATLSKAPLGSGSDFIVGAGNRDYWIGTVDEAAIVSRALTAGEIGDLYTASGL